MSNMNHMKIKRMGPKGISNIGEHVGWPRNAYKDWIANRGRRGSNQVKEAMGLGGHTETYPREKRMRQEDKGRAAIKANRDGR